jgi:hypothetical protein
MRQIKDNEWDQMMASFAQECRKNIPFDGVDIVYVSLY